MEKRSRSYTWIGFLAMVLAGILLHFLYDLTGRAVWIGLFSPINESVWEHMKLVFYTLTVNFLSKIICTKKKIPALSPASAWGILAGTFSIPVAFYTYTGILGYHTLALDMGVFLLGVFIGFYTQSKIIRKSTFPTTENSFLPWGLVLLTCLCFFIFTFRPPSLPPFSHP